MDTSIAKKTQDSLGKIIKKPPLTEKLLSKPPFRFLHDVVTSVIKTTGFMQGLFTDAEMNSENVKDKDSKVAFLQKVVDMVAAVIGRSLSVKPIKIVAGHEPEKTNELLQFLASAINKNVDNDEYVKRVMKGDSAEGSKGGSKDDKKEKSSKDRTKSADRRKSDADGKAEKEKDGEKSRDKGERDRHSERDKSKGDRDRHRDSDRERESKTRERSRDGRDDKRRDKSRRSFPPELERKAPSNSRKSLPGHPSPLPPTSNTPPGATPKPAGSKIRQALTDRSGTGSSATTPASKKPNMQRQKPPPHHQGSPSSGLEKTKTPSSKGQVGNQPGGDSSRTKASPLLATAAATLSEGDTSAVFDSKSQGDGLGMSNSSVVDTSEEAMSAEKEMEDCRDASKEKENESPGRQNGEKEEKEHPPRLQRPSSAKGSRRRREEDEEFQKEMAPSRDAMIGEGDLPPQIAASRQLARPSSARPAPPRPKQEASESEPAMRLGGGQPTNVIVDNGNDDEDDDENFLVEESAPPPPDLEPQPISKPADDDDAEHGALVKKMLESKKELEGGSQAQQPAQTKKTEIERPTMSDAQRRKQREQVQKEVDKLRTSIQSLTRSANPLGKVMDYVQEDLDSMQQELDKWRQENAQHALDLKREMNVTDRAVEPLKQQLAELERAIGDQLDQIAASKSQIIRNDVKMEKMLKSIAKS